MSKQAQVENDRIPSYEESIATCPPLLSTSSTRKISPRLTIQQRAREERVRRIAVLITNHLEATISKKLEDGIAHLLIIILPTDAFPSPTSTTLSTKSITSPILPLPTNLLNLRSSLHADEREEDYKSSFLVQSPVIHDLTYTLQQSLLTLDSLSANTHQRPHPTPPQSAPEPPTSAPLPPHPTPRSWLSRNLSRLNTIPPPDHDPTGSTGAWNLGWRSEEDPTSTQASCSNDDLCITTRLQDVTFRTENDMGLWESRSVKCVWLEMEFKG